jgi:GNAT superfamily N-acetyltransferase
MPTFSASTDIVIAAEVADEALMALLSCDRAELAAWRRAGNHPYIATIAGEPVACGWSAWTQLEIGELGIDRLLPAGDRYLWGFITAERWRGRGIYPRLLAAIVRREGGRQRYWIGHEPGNRSSGRGIVKAGFARVGKIYRDPAGEYALEVLPGVNTERAMVGASVLGAYVYGAGDGEEQQPAQPRGARQ